MLFWAGQVYQRILSHNLEPSAGAQVGLKAKAT
jgi:hypothetical protein